MTKMLFQGVKQAKKKKKERKRRAQKVDLSLQLVKWAIWGGTVDDERPLTAPIKWLVDS